MNLKNKRVLVTGAEGFIGSHLAERLVDEGASVKAFILYNSFNSWGWIDTFDEKTKEKIEIFPGDVRDPEGVRKAAEGIDVIFHLAALVSIPFSYHSPDCFVDTNVRGTLNVLQAARALGVGKVLVTSTSEVYGTARYVPIDEAHPLQGQSPYSASKIGADKVAESFFRSFDLPVSVVRPFNTYGPRQSARAVIPNIITQLLSGTKEIRLGDLSPTRDFLYVKDTVDAFAEIAKCDDAAGETINIATGSEVSIKDLVDTLIALIDPAAKVVQEKERFRPEKSEVKRLLGSNEKIRSLTGWKPRYTLKQGLAETVRWFDKEENLRWYKPHIYNY
ncbi:MAG: SDR family NAD(P)-dependent oxidoreductase [Spirochaetes bacterium]|nr:SDR family NAD(P)-dependent oxidoreductase [Spirochaetota bacterium]